MSVGSDYGSVKTDENTYKVSRSDGLHEGAGPNSAMTDQVILYLLMYMYRYLHTDVTTGKQLCKTANLCTWL